MTWAKNLLFLAVVGGGLTALAVNILPPPRPMLLSGYDGRDYHEKSFRDTVAAVDKTFEDKWQSEGVQPAKPAADLQQARRISLALMGTVPSLEEIRQFEALPPEQRLPWYIDNVMADGRFHDYFAERLARAYVGTEGGPFIMFRRNRFVTWLSEQLAENKPYDGIVRELIAGTGLWTDHPATNFVSVTSRPEEKNQPDPVRLAGRVTRAFLGIRLDCAQCHNHPFAEWKQSDFQSLSAFFGQTAIGFRGVQDGGGEYEAEDRYTKKMQVVPPKVPVAEELLPEDGTRRERLAAWVTHPKNPYFAKATVNRVWALVFGQPLVEPVDNLEPGVPLPPVLQLLADDFTENGYDLRRLVRLIAMSKAYRQDSASDHEIGEKEESLLAVFPLTRLRPEQVAGSVLQASSVTSLDSKTHILFRLARAGERNEFVQRYGDMGEDEFDARGGTIPQRLLLMNGKMVRERIGGEAANATNRIANVAPNDAKAVETAYLAVLSRRPTPEEAAHFEKLMADSSKSRSQRVEDLYWALVNSTEFSWNH